MICTGWPRKEKIRIGSLGLEITARREPSGERSQNQPQSFFGSTSKRRSSEPRPFRGSKAETITCFRSPVRSAIVHKFEGGLAQEITLTSRKGNINSGDPPEMGTRARRIGWDGPLGSGIR